MKHLCLLKNTRTTRHEAIIIFEHIEPGTVIGWGSDEQDPEGAARWTVQTCEPMK